MRRSVGILLCMVPVSLVLGIWGIRQQSPELGWTSCVYEAVQLFSLNYNGPSESVPVVLDIARFVSPVVAGLMLASVFAFFESVKEWMRVLTQARLKDHDVVLGLGAQGEAIARDLMGAGRQVVIVEQCATEPEVEEMARLGALVLIGDAGEKRMLERARIWSARCIYCAAGRDDVNLGLTLTAADFITETKSAGKRIGYRERQTVEIRTHVSNVYCRDVLLRSRSLERGHQPEHEIRVFNIYQNLARIILQRHPLEVGHRGGGEGKAALKLRPHLIISHCDDAAMALILHAARVCHYPDGQKVTVHLMTKTAVEDRRRLLAQYPDFEKCAGLVATVVEDSAVLAQKVVGLLGGFGGQEFATVFMHEVAEYSALALAFTIRERMGNRCEKFRVLIWPTAHRGVERILNEWSKGIGHCGGGKSPEGATDGLDKLVQYIPELKEACGRDALDYEGLDVIAKKIHQTWFDAETKRLEEERRAGRAVEEKATYKPWGECADEHRDSNRAAADHLVIKIRVAGFSPSEGALGEKWDREVSGELLETLSKMEHERWCADRWLSGWKHGEKRNDAMRIHDNLVPYAELTEWTKNNDRSQVRNVPGYLVAGVSRWG